MPRPHSSSLSLYEEALLLTLRNEKGTAATGYSEQAIAGAVLAEMLLAGRVRVDDSTKNKLVDIFRPEPSGDPIIDECLAKMVAAKNRASLKTWVQRLAGIKRLRHRVAQRLCDRGILRADRDKVLLVFDRDIYPEIDPAPERKIVDRMREAIFTEKQDLDPRIVVLISLAHSVGVLQGIFGRREVRERKKRIERIVQGELAGKATKEVIEACQAAAAVAIMVTTIASSARN